MKTVDYHEFTRHFWETARINRIPITGLFELTPLCNLDCKMCYVHLQDPTVKARMLSGEQWIGIMKDAVGYGMLDAILSGGEALTHPDFWMIYDYLSRTGTRVRLKTNGLLLNEETVHRLATCPPYLVEISLYGCNTESYFSVTGHDVFEKVSVNIARIRDTGIPVRIIVTPSKFMFPWIDEMFGFAKSFGVQVKVNSLLMPPREKNGNPKEAFDLTREETLYIERKAYELFGEEVSNEADDSMESPNPVRKILGDTAETKLHCSAGKTGFAIHWNGIMVPCTGFQEEIISGNALEDGFGTAWQTVTQQAKVYERPEVCQKCAYHDLCYFCPPLHNSYAVHRMCDPESCVRIQCIIDERLSAERN